MTRTSDTYKIGIANVSSRIKLIFGNSYGLQIQSAKTVGTTIQLNFPAMTLKEMQAYVQDSGR